MPWVLSCHCDPHSEGVGQLLEWGTLPVQDVAHASTPFLCRYCSGFRRMDCLLQVFTAGPFAMEVSAKMYGATWKFNEQGLPFDLEARYSSARRLGKKTQNFTSAQASGYQYAVQSPGCALFLLRVSGPQRALPLRQPGIIF